MFFNVIQHLWIQFQLREEWPTGLDHWPETNSSSPGLSQALFPWWVSHSVPGLALIAPYPVAGRLYVTMPTAVTLRHTRSLKISHRWHAMIKYSVTVLFRPSGWWVGWMHVASQVDTCCPGHWGPTVRECLAVKQKGFSLPLILVFSLYLGPWDAHEVESCFYYRTV